MRYRLLSVGLAVLGLAGCSDTARLVPANAQAQAVGSPVLHYMTGVPGGPMFITMPDGENLSGDFAVDEGPAGPVSETGGPARYFGLSGGNFRVTAHGQRTAIACRARLVGGQGDGICRDQNGAMYHVKL